MLRSGGGGRWRLSNGCRAAANLFRPPGSGFGYDCLRFGLKARDNGELTELYLSMLERRLASVGLRDAAADAGLPARPGLKVNG